MGRLWLMHVFLVLICRVIIPAEQKTAPALRPSPALRLNGQHNKTISGLIISADTADCIRLYNCENIIINNCRFGPSKKNGVTLENCRNITIVNCSFEKVATGVYALSSRGVRVNYNRFKNMQGPFPRGQMVQLDSVSGAGNQVSYNRGENLPGLSNPEDAINIYKSSGTPASPIVVNGNRIRGGGPSKTGGGIMLGDNGGAYIIAKNNILVNPGQYGMAIAGGTHIGILNNTIYARRQPFTNVGIYVWNQHPSGCAINQVRGNSVNFTNAAGEQNPAWNAGNCGIVEGWNNNQWAAPITASILPLQLFNK